MCVFLYQHSGYRPPPGSRCYSTMGPAAIQAVVEKTSAVLEVVQRCADAAALIVEAPRKHCKMLTCSK